jgi:hypothetical protein
MSAPGPLMRRSLNISIHKTFASCSPRFATTSIAGGLLHGQHFQYFSITTAVTAAPGADTA